jgi:hypothetical protein
MNLPDFPTPQYNCSGIFAGASGQMAFYGSTASDLAKGFFGYSGTLYCPRCAPVPGSTASGTSTTGGGWLADDAGNKVNFGFNAQQGPSGPKGNLELNDKFTGVKIHLDTVTAIGPVPATSPCGAVPANKANSLEFYGTGSYNGAAGASFRVCVQDNAEPGAGHDLFHLECTSGCVYNTDTRSPSDVIAGGNIQVRAGQSSTSSSSSSTTLHAATIILDPLLQSSGIAGQTQLFTAAVYDQNQLPLANATVTLTGTAANGAVQTLTALTNASGLASLATVDLSQTAEYIASAGVVQSNAIVLSASP